MAQDKNSIARALKRGKRRFGMSGPRATAVACIVLVAILGACGVFRMGVAPSFEVDRGEDVVQQEVENHAAIENMPPATNEEGGLEEARMSRVLVHVDGAVVSPGVYELVGESPRANDAIACAGGLTEDADTTSINLAMEVVDGQKIHVPSVGEEPVSWQEPYATVEQGVSPGETNSNVININTATEQELQALPGVGEATAASIVKDREQNGAFASPEDIMRVSGIGEKKYEKMKDQICV